MRSALQLFLTSFIFLCASGYSAKGQLSPYEMELIENVNRVDHSFDPRRPAFLKIGNNAITRYNPISLFFSGSLFFYQKVISPQLQSRCPYEISCSAFSKASIEEFGIIKGIPLTADRLTRCTQFTIIDILPSQINPRTGQIIDNPDKYRTHRHQH
jgi:putative component of membrane protein insertase Oxa1/YidC/SpoIIIJ protein YidD